MGYSTHAVGKVRWNLSGGQHPQLLKKKITSILSLQSREKKAMLVVLTILFLENIMKMELPEERNAFNLFLTTNMASVTSLANKQLLPQVHVLPSLYNYELVFL